jgi:hypothetical protein
LNAFTGPFNNLYLESTGERIFLKRRYKMSKKKDPWYFIIFELATHFVVGICWFLAVMGAVCAGDHPALV